jgi:hypothetical protein
MHAKTADMVTSPLAVATDLETGHVKTCPDVEARVFPIADEAFDPEPGQNLSSESADETHVRMFTRHAKFC